MCHDELRLHRLGRSAQREAGAGGGVDGHDDEQGDEPPLQRGRVAGVGETAADDDAERLARVKGTTVPQSIEPGCSRVLRATTEFIAITSKEVPIQRRHDHEAATNAEEAGQEPDDRARDGNLRNGERFDRDDSVVVGAAAAPTDRAATGVLAAVGPAVRRTRRHMASAAMSIRPEKASSRRSGLAALFKWEPSSEPPTPARPKTTPAPKRTHSHPPMYPWGYPLLI